MSGGGGVPKKHALVFSILACRPETGKKSDITLKTLRIFSSVSFIFCKSQFKYRVKSSAKDSKSFIRSPTLKPQSLHSCLSLCAKISRQIYKILLCILTYLEIYCLVQTSNIYQFQVKILAHHRYVYFCQTVYL